METLCIACDFDGTITERDTLHVIVEHFGQRSVWDALEPDLRSGAITVEQALQAEFDTVRADLTQVHETLRLHAPVRAGFREFVEWAHSRGHDLFVCSNGFRSVIEPILDDAGVDVPVIANDATFTANGTTITWQDRGRRCDLCDRPCKRAPMRVRAGGRRLVMIGDGISDRCGAGLADVVLARAGLAQDMRDQGRTFIPFNDFHDVRAALAQVEATR